ncbi:hypothetical protein MO867_15310 [Microbulbifer sp. OS29]|uniref:DUF2975 domain-containing protein n=1 Tax=Microbulbifer okhotskensis TaxID=2926617 RepID=A0A9X2EUB5_9GAMM|nr:hypothetical protein [Microbulbifer okhotskensis]MCO1335703.1 hypothetical protein [Microbulbifer okhotskensis]
MQQVTAVALRLLAIWLLIQLIINLPTLILIFTSVQKYQQREIPITAYVGLIGTFLIVGLAAVFLINKSATSILTRTKSDPENALSKDTQAILFQIAGLYFVVNSLAYLPRSLSFIPSTIDASMSSLMWPIGLLFQLFIGLWLITNTTFWLKLFNKLRGRN